MRFVKIAVFLVTAALVASSVFAQDDVIARAYRTVNVRSGPSTEYDIIGQLNSGDEVQITGRSDDESNWLRIDFQNKEGWVAFFTVTVLGKLEPVPLATPRSDLGTAHPAPTPNLIQASSDVFVTAYRSVNVRSGPGIEYVSIGNLEAGSSADVTGRSSDNEWLRITYGSETGWVAFFVVSLNGSLADIDVAEASADAQTEAPPSTVGIVTRYNLNLHEKPILDSAIIAIIPFDVSLQAEARSDAAESWLRVTYNGQSGWIIRALVNATGELSILPIDQA